MRRLASFLVASVLVAVPSCERTGLHTPPAGTGGMTALGGVTGPGGVQSTGGHIGAGGAVSGAGGSSSDMCYSDSDCVTCIWETVPTDSSDCTGSYCCGGMVSTKARCEANQAAWNSYCPRQSPADAHCPCGSPSCPGQAVPGLACIGGQCVLSCPAGTGGSTVFPLGSGGSPETGTAGVSNPGYVAGGAGGAGGIAGMGGVAGTGGRAGTGGIVGTGGSSSGGGGGSCSKVPACGGDVVGTWTVTSSCLSVAGQMDISLLGIGCTSATVTGSLKVTGTWTANSDGTYSDETTTTGDEHLTLPASCLQISGTTTTCERVAPVLQSLGYAVTMCTSAASGGCTCSATVNQTGWMGLVNLGASTRGQYTTSGNVVTLDNEARYSFCVSGKQLNMTPQGTSPTTGTVVLQKSGTSGATTTGGSGGTSGSGVVFGSGGIGGTGGAGSSVETSGDAGCVTPTAGATCSATSVVCEPNGCCGLWWECIDGQWGYGPPCPCY